MVDNVNGGFYGRIDRNDKVYPEAEKGGILNARILWTYSSAYRVLGDTSYLRMAKRAKDYILTHFIDSQFGGAFRALKPTALHQIQGNRCIPMLFSFMVCRNTAELQVIKKHWQKQGRFLIFSRSMQLTGSITDILKSSAANG